MTTSTVLEPYYIVDTHALIWYLLGDKELSRRARAIFEAAEQNNTLLVLPVIVLAELYYANSKNGWFGDFAHVYNDLINKPYIRMVSLEHVHIADFTVDSAVPEMLDRIITGVARRLNAPLITSDPLITKAGIVQTIW